MVQGVGRILPFDALIYFTLVLMVMIANYLQSIGDAMRSTLLSLARIFAIPLTFVLPAIMGEAGIWTALPIADAMPVITTGVVL